jgi:hypothetical protein
MIKVMTRRDFLLAGTALAAGAAGAGMRVKAAESAGGGGRIGFVDDDLNNYHADVFLQALRGRLKERGFQVSACTGLKKEAGRRWADKNGVRWFETVAAMDGAVDFYMVLAPSTPETHLELCRQVFPFGKPVYVDKTFAPSLAVAREIFGLADRHGALVQTSSALRYTNVQEEVARFGQDQVGQMITWGPGGSFDEYAIHPVELLVSVMGGEVRRMMRVGPEHRSQLLVEFAGDRTGVVNVYTNSNTPFAASVTTGKLTRQITVEMASLFVDTMAAQLDFFASGRVGVDRGESLAIMAILDGARKEKGRWWPLEV